jgi:hypothetical protein
MPPPEKNVGLGQDLLTQAMFGFVQGGRAHRQPGLAQRLGNGLVDAGRVNSGNLRVVYFVSILIPDGYTG